MATCLIGTPSNRVPLPQTDIPTPMTQIRNTRLDWLDQTRGLALVAMTAYHLTWDLFSMGLSSINPVSTPFLVWSAKSIAAMFLLLSGLSLTLAHSASVNWQQVWSRLLRLSLAAGLVSLGSYYLFPASWIAFGILHHMALAGLIGLLFLRMHPFGLLGLAVLCLILPDIAKNDIFNTGPWLFLGLSTVIAPANDYVPLLPWFAFVLVGIALPQILPQIRHRTKKQTQQSFRLLGFLGRHSLLYYLIHQLVLLGTLNLLLAMGILVPAQTTKAHFTQACERDCSFDQGDETLCRRICSCIFENLQQTPLILTTPPSAMTAEQENKLRTAIKQCR